MSVYVEGHGQDSSIETFVPASQRLHFYSENFENAEARLTLYAQSKEGIQRPLETITGGVVQNYALSALTSDEYGYSLALKEAGLNVRYVGDDAELFDGMLLCGRQGAGECSQAKIEERGHHDCDGLLGILRDEADIHMMTCRGGWLSNKATAVPQEAKGYFDPVDAEAAKLANLIASDPERAWARIEELGDHRSDNAAANQELLIMVYNSNGDIHRWADRYGALRYLRQWGNLPFYRMYLSRGDAAGAWLADSEIKACVDWADKYFADLDKAVAAYRAAEVDATSELPRTFWQGLSEQQREDIVAIDDTFRDKVIVNYFAPSEATAPRPPRRQPDWGKALEHSVAVLKGLSEGDEHAWIRYDTGQILVDTFSRHAAEAAKSDDAYPFHAEYAELKDAVGLADIRVESKDGARMVLSVDDETAEYEGFKDAIAALNGKAAGSLLLEVKGGFRGVLF